jgi:guanine deaminase
MPTMVMSHDDLMEEACRLAKESVDNNWGGPFGAVVADKDGAIIARGQNRVLLTGDVTAHAEMEAIRKALAVLNPEAPSIAPGHLNDYTLEFIPRPAGSSDPVPERARMLSGYDVFTSGAPCPMCMSAIYWARLDATYFAFDYDTAAKIGFDDKFQYEDFARPMDKRRVKIGQFRPELSTPAVRAWEQKHDKHPY